MPRADGKAPAANAPAAKAASRGASKGAAARASSEIGAGEAARQAMEQVKGLTGREALAVASLEPVEDGWRVGVEVLEDARVPSSGDILALYEAEIGLDGELLSYRRARRYRRGDVGVETAGDV